MAGQVVTAGFIDLHSHVNDVGGLRLQALDGVTTALELEAGVTPVADAYRRAAEQGRPVNYGFSASWALARMETVAGLPAQASLGAFMARISDPAWQRAAAPAQLTALLDRISADLADGALGIGVLLGYAPAASPEEYLRVAGLAARSGVATFTHARDLVEMVPATLADGAEEIVRAAGETGAHMHYCHVNSTSHRHIDRVLALVARAQAAGSRVTTEAYPYGSGMTGIGAAFLAPERLGERGLSPSSLTYAPTGERVASEARLRELRRADPGGLVIIDLLDESSAADRALLMRSLTFPGSVVASDAMPLTWTAPPADPLAWPLPPTAITHPRTAGTFCRALRLLTREAPDWAGAGGVAGVAGWLGCRRCSPGAASSRPGCSRAGCRSCAGRGACRSAGTPTSWCSIRRRSPTGPATPTAPGRRPASGTCWSTASSWCAMVASCPTPGPGGRSGPSRGSRRGVSGNVIRTQLSCENKHFPR